MCHDSNEIRKNAKKNPERIELATQETINKRKLEINVNIGRRKLETNEDERKAKKRGPKKTITTSQDQTEISSKNKQMRSLFPKILWTLLYMDKGGTQTDEN